MDEAALEVLVNAAYRSGLAEGRKKEHERLIESLRVGVTEAEPWTLGTKTRIERIIERLDGEVDLRMSQAG